MGENLKKELLKIEQELLNYWLYNVCNNMAIFDLYIEISHLIYKLPTEQDSQDLVLANIMTIMERQFKIPMLGIFIPEWLQENKSNKFLLSIYEKISALRSI